jgi:cell division protein FtsB
MPHRKFRQIFWSQRGILVWLLVLIALFAGWCIWTRSTITRYTEERGRRDKSRSEVETLRSEIQQLEREKTVLGSGGFEAEKAARERLRYSRPGEEILYIDAAPNSETTYTR